MKIATNKEERYTLLNLLEENLNSLHAPQVKSEFVLLNASGVRNMIVNLQHVNYIDSSGLSAILTANRICEEAGGVLVLCHLTEKVEKLINITRLDEVLNIIPTEKEAIEQVIMADIEADLLAGTEEDTITATNA